MEKSIEIFDLRSRIELLENQRKAEYLVLKSDFECILNSIKPTNIIKKTLREVSTTTEITDIMLSTSIGLATGYISKKIIVGKSINPIKKLLGVILQFSVASAVARNPQTIKAIGNYLIHLISRKKNDK